MYLFSLKPLLLAVTVNEFLTAQHCFRNFVLSQVIFSKQKSGFRERKAAKRRCFWYTDIRREDDANPGYRWLHTCHGTLSSLSQWRPQSPPWDGTAPWCWSPAEKTDTWELERRKRLGIWDEYSELLLKCKTHKILFLYTQRPTVACWFRTMLLLTPDCNQLYLHFVQFFVLIAACFQC